MLTPLEHLGYQALFHLRGERVWDDRIVLVAIDDASLTKIGRFPWPRQQYVQLLQTLERSRSNMVVFDLLFSEASEDDPDLAEAMSQHGKVILAQAWDSEGTPLVPVSVLQQSAIGIGHILAQQDNDGIVRQVMPQVHQVPALAMTTIQAYRLLKAEVPLPDLQAPLWANWVGQTTSLPHYSFADVVQGKVNPAVFNDKIVLVGVTATGLDPLVSPFDRNPPTSSVILHAVLIQNLLQQSTLQPWIREIMAGVLLLGGPVLSWFLGGRGWLKQVAVVSGLWAFWVIFSVGLLNANILVPLVAPLLLFLVTGSATGISDRLRESAVLRHQIQGIQQEEALKEEFLRTASHELRAPVANIQSAISLLRMTDSESDREEYLQILEEECQQEFAIINDLLDFQRLSVQAAKAEYETQNLHEWLLEVAAPFSMRAKTSQQTLHLRADPPDAILTLDWLSLHRILAELLNNACKYTPNQGLIQVEAEVMGAHLTCRVSNSGVVLPESELEKLFQPFYRNVEVDHRQQGGTGLGLAIVKRLTEQLQGEVQVNQWQDQLVFTVRLPIPQECTALEGLL
jgi:signal transduction histidine kinase